MDRAFRRRHGGPRRLRLCELRRDARLGICLWPGRGPPLAAQIRHRGRAALFPKRRALPAPIPMTHGALSKAAKIIAMCHSAERSDEEFLLFLGLILTRRVKEAR